MNTLRQVAETIESDHLLSQGDSVLVALSGGPDSVTLLHVLSRLKKRYRLSLHAVYINHQIRKRAALKEEKFCQTLCDRLRVPLTIIREDIPALARRERKGIEEAARDFRYDTFERLAEEKKCRRIALGHHIDDRVETIIFRIFRGTGRTGVIGMPIARAKIIRPLFDLSKADILAYLKKNRFSYCQDRSNEGIEYSRNYIRNRLLPQVRQRLNPKVEVAILNLSEIVGDEETFLEQTARKAARRALKFTPGGKIQLDLTALRTYDIWLRRRLLRRCVQIASAERLVPDRTIIDRLDRLALGSGKPISLPGRLQAITVGNKLVLHAVKRRTFEVALEPGSPAYVPELNMSVRSRWVRSTRSRLDRRRGALKVALDGDRIHGPIVVRNVRDGDRFRPLGLAGTKKVGDFLTDRKVPVVYRDEVPAVCDCEGIIWLVGYEIADRVKITDQTRRMLRIEVSFGQARGTQTV